MSIFPVVTAQEEQLVARLAREFTFVPQPTPLFDTVATSNGQTEFDFGATSASFTNDSQFFFDPTTPFSTTTTAENVFERLGEEQAEFDFDALFQAEITAEEGLGQGVSFQI